MKPTLQQSITGTRKKAKSRLDSRYGPDYNEVSNFPEITQWGNGKPTKLSQRPAPIFSTRQLQWTPPVDPKTSKVANLNSKMIHSHLAQNKKREPSAPHASASQRYEQQYQSTSQAKPATTNSLNPPFPANIPFKIKRQHQLSSNTVMQQLSAHKPIPQNSQQSISQATSKKFARNRSHTKKHQALIAELEGQGIQVQIIDTNHHDSQTQNQKNVDLSLMKSVKNNDLNSISVVKKIAQKRDQIDTPKFQGSASSTQKISPIKQLMSLPQTMSNQSGTVHIINPESATNDSKIKDKNNKAPQKRNNEKNTSESAYGLNLNESHESIEMRQQEIIQTSINSLRKLPKKRIIAKGEKTGKKRAVAQLPLHALVADDQYSSATDPAQNSISMRNSIENLSEEKQNTINTDKKQQNQPIAIEEQYGDESPQIANRSPYDSINSNQDTSKQNDSKGFTKFNLSIQCNNLLNPTYLGHQSTKSKKRARASPSKINSISSKAHPHRNSSVETEIKSPLFSNQKVSLTGQSPSSHISLNEGDASPVLYPSRQTAQLSTHKSKTAGVITAATAAATSTEVWKNLAQEMLAYGGVSKKHEKALLVPNHRDTAYKKVKRPGNVPQTSHTKVDSGLNAVRNLTKKPSQLPSLPWNPNTTRSILGEPSPPTLTQDKKLDRVNSEYSIMSPMKHKGEIKLDNEDDSGIPHIGNIQVTHKSSVMESTDQSPLDDEMVRALALTANFANLSMLQPHQSYTTGSKPKSLLSKHNHKDNRVSGQSSRSSPFQVASSSTPSNLNMINYQSLSLQDFQFGKPRFQ